MAEKKQTMLDLYDELKPVYESWEKLLEASEGVVTTEVAILEEELLPLTGAIEKKWDGYGFYMRKLKAEAKAAREEARAFTKKAARMDAQYERMRERVRYVLETNKLERFETDRYRFRLQTNSVRPILNKMGMPISVEDVPKRFQKVLTSVDRTALKEALDAGRTVRGIHLGDAGQHVRVEV